MDLDEHMEWIDTESSIAPTVWGMLTSRMKQRARFERYRLRCSAMDKIINVLFPLMVSFICGSSWNVERIFVCPYFSTSVTNVMHVEYRWRRGVFVNLREPNLGGRVSVEASRCRRVALVGHNFVQIVTP